MRALPLIVLLLTMIPLIGCGEGGQTLGVAGPEIAHDRTTPEGAILTLEDAYRAQDLEAALACRDFEREAELMLEKLGDGEFSKDEAMVQQTAEVLKLGYTAEVGQAFPDFRGITSTFSDKKPYNGRTDVVELSETCTSSGGTTVNKMHAAKTDDGWKVISIAGE